MHTCDRCQAYEDHVMAGGDDLAPCDDYEMTEPFKAWVVERMQDEIRAQIASAGLQQSGGQQEQDEQADDTP